MTHLHNNLIKLMIVAIMTTMIVVPHSALAYPAVDHYPRTMAPYMKIVAPSDLTRSPNSTWSPCPRTADRGTASFSRTQKTQSENNFARLLPHQKLHHRLGRRAAPCREKRIDASWFLKDASGNTLSVCPHAGAFNNERLEPIRAAVCS